MPYSTVVAGTVITASWANANVRDQVVTPFTNSTARSSAISSPVEGMVSYLADVNRFDFYNGTAWQPVAGVASRVFRSGDQTITNGVVTPVEWQTVAYDDFSMWAASPNPERLTAPWAGFYIPSASVSWSSSSNGFYRRLTLYLNGSPLEGVSVQLDNAADTNPLRQQITAAGILMDAGEYVEVRVTHDAGANRTIEANLSSFRLAYLGPAV